MKKVVLGVLAVVTLICCKQKTEQEKIVSEPAVMVKTLPCSGCEPAILVDATKVDAAWRNANKDYICAGLPEIKIDLCVMTAPGQWLKNNQSKIDFGRSAPLILAAHKINDPRNATEFKKIAVGAIRSAAGSAFDTYNYDHYVVFTAGSDAVTATLGSHDTANVCFSIPLLKSLINTHQLKETDSLEFGKDNVGTYFRVYDRNLNQYVPYDITNNPAFAVM